MGAGHSFLVLEGPLSEDTHSLDPAPDKSGGPPPDFFFLFFFLSPLLAILHIFTFLFSFFLLPQFFSLFFLFTYRNPRHCRHVAESRLLPASQASPSWTALRRTYSLPLAVSILHCT